MNYITPKKEILICFDSFKDCLSSYEIGKTVDESLKELKFDTNIETEILRISDGGEGLLECLKQSLGLKIQTVNGIIGPLGEIINNVKYGYNEIEGYAVIEMAEAAGIQLVPEIKRSPFNTTTYGVGQLIKHAIEIGGFNTIYIGAGGSSTNDAGLGSLQALDIIKTNLSSGGEIIYGRNLNEINEIIINEEVRSKYSNIKFYFIADVTNPMIGKNGAVYSFSHQKGAHSDKEKEVLENGMVNISKLLPIDISMKEGAGAAGGLPSSWLSIFSNQTNIIKGMEFVCKSYKLDEKFNSDKIQLIITGEGCVDVTTLSGKVVSKMYEYSNNFNVPLLIICGKNKLELNEQALICNNNVQIYDLVSNFGTDQSLNNTKHCINTLFKENQNLSLFLNNKLFIS